MSFALFLALLWALIHLIGIAFALMLHADGLREIAVVPDGEQYDAQRILAFREVATARFWGTICFLNEVLLPIAYIPGIATETRNILSSVIFILIGVLIVVALGDIVRRRRDAWNILEHLLRNDDGK